MDKEKQHVQAAACEADDRVSINMDTGSDNNGRKHKKNEAAELRGARVKELEEARNELKDIRSELEDARRELEERTKQSSEIFDKMQRIAAEYDNFKKRSAKEKEALYADAVNEVVCAFIPVLDNVERALLAIPEGDVYQALKEGVELIHKQFKEAMASIGVEEIEAVDEQFDPNLHDAVMHVEDESYGHNTVVEEFQRGYTCKNRVIRYSKVKVAN